jgi:hypothetical protein
MPSRPDSESSPCFLRRVPDFARRSGASCNAFPLRQFAAQDHIGKVRLEVFSGEHNWRSERTRPAWSASGRSEMNYAAKSTWNVGRRR